MKLIATADFHLYAWTPRSSITTIYRTTHPSIGVEVRHRRDDIWHHYQLSATAWRRPDAEARGSYTLEYQAWKTRKRRKGEKGVPGGLLRVGRKAFIRLKIGLGDRRR